VKEDKSPHRDDLHYPVGQTGPYKDIRAGISGTHPAAWAIFRPVKATRPGTVEISGTPFQFPGRFVRRQRHARSLYRQKLTGEGMQLDVSEQESVIQNVTPPSRGILT